MPAHTTTLGHTGLTVSRLCLGTMTWGSHVPATDAEQRMDFALSQGLNFWDTAELYPSPASPETFGLTESIIGNWLKRTGQRNQLVLASKVAGPGRANIRGGSRLNRANILAACEASLQRLGTDYLDLYQIHWPDRPNYHFQSYWAFQPEADAAHHLENFHEVLTTLSDLVQQGKIRHIGICNESAWGIGQYVQLAEKFSLPRIATLQNEYSLLCRRADTDVAETCTQENIAYLAWSPLAMGVLSNQYAGASQPSDSRLTVSTNSILNAHISPAGLAAAQAYATLAESVGLSPVQLALAFVLSRPFITCPIIGFRTLAQLQHNISALDVRLSTTVLDGIAAIHRQYPMPY